MVTTYFDVIKDKKTLTIKREIIVIAMAEQNACVYFRPISLYTYEKKQRSLIFQRRYF